MIENERPKKTFSRSVTQLAYLCDLRAQVKSGNFPLTHYSSGEVATSKLVKNKDGEWITKETYVELPIWPDPHDSRQKGLMHAVDHAIFSRWLDLKELGRQEEADEVILYDGFIPPHE